MSTAGGAEPLACEPASGGGEPRTTSRAGSAIRPPIRRPASGPAGREERAAARRSPACAGMVTVVRRDRVTVATSLAVRRDDDVDHRGDRAGEGPADGSRRFLATAWSCAGGCGLTAVRSMPRVVSTTGASVAQAPAGDVGQGGRRGLQPGAQQHRHERKQRQGTPQRSGRAPTLRRSTVQRSLDPNGSRRCNFRSMPFAAVGKGADRVTDDGQQRGCRCPSRFFLTPSASPARARA